MVEVRLATLEDARGILEIYSPCVLGSSISFETLVPSLEEMQNRISTGLQKYPWIVAVVRGQVAGYVYASRHREREAYQWSCECSVYVRPEWKGKGLASKLYQLLFLILKHQGFRNVFAGITLPNEPSVRLHERCGFTKFAEYEMVGNKFGSWHTVGWWKLQIHSYDLNPPPPVNIADLEFNEIADLFRQTTLDLRSAIY